MNHQCAIVQKTMRKQKPETSCHKVSRNICAASDCQYVRSDAVCYNETQRVIQSVPKEECGLEPQENCSMETVMVPK